MFNQDSKSANTRKALSKQLRELSSTGMMAKKGGFGSVLTFPGSSSSSMNNDKPVEQLKLGF